MAAYEYKVTDELARINNMSADSFPGAIGAFFLLQIYGFFIFQIFLSYISPLDLAAIIVLPFAALFFGIQSGTLSILGKAFSKRSFAHLSSFGNALEFARWILAILFVIVFISFIFGFYYPYRRYEYDLAQLAGFYVFSWAASLAYGRYVEHYAENKGPTIPKLGEYGLEGSIVILTCTAVFSAAAFYFGPTTFFPVTIFFLLGSGILMIMLARLMLE